jgi:hypothetical protein
MIVEAAQAMPIETSQGIIAALKTRVMRLVVRSMFDHCETK